MKLSLVTGRIHRTLPEYLPASEGTAEIVTRRVSRVGEEEDSAVVTTLETSPQSGFCLDCRAKDTEVRRGETACLPFTVPVQCEFEVALKLYCRKARFSLAVLKTLFTPSSYPLGTDVSMGRTWALSLVIGDSGFLALRLGRSVEDGLR